MVFVLYLHNNHLISNILFLPKGLVPGSLLLLVIIIILVRIIEVFY